MVDCFLCQLPRQCGPHRYEERNIPAWDVWICDLCCGGNWDGIVNSSPRGHRLIQHLRDRGIDVFA